MIISIGSDIIDIKRIENVINKSECNIWINKKLLNKQQNKSNHKQIDKPKYKKKLKLKNNRRYKQRTNYLRINI